MNLTVFNGKEPISTMNPGNILCSALVLCLALTLSGCGASSTKAQSTRSTEAPVIAAAVTEQPVESTPSDAPSGMSIPLSELTQEPKFFDWNENGTDMQLIALTDASGEVQLAYNTCQVCAGSPYAYFELENERLICQNCGNAFPYSAVGKMSGGCNPMPVSNNAVSADTIDIPSDELAKNVKAFANWKGAK